MNELLYECLQKMHEGKISGVNFDISLYFEQDNLGYNLFPFCLFSILYSH